MISKRDSKPFQVKFSVGVEKTNKINVQYYEEWHTCWGIVRDTASKANHYYGYEAIYDKIITVNAGSITRLIDYDTLFCVDNIPTSVYKGGDYSAEQIYPEYNGEIVIGLKKKDAINIPKLYFEHNGKILYYQLNFDNKTKKAYIPIKSILPFKEGDYVWTREPADSSITSNRLLFQNKSKTGVDSQFKNFYELTFIEE
jgi:hypothetical protein